MEFIRTDRVLEAKNIEYKLFLPVYHMLRVDGMETSAPRTSRKSIPKSLPRWNSLTQSGTPDQTVRYGSRDLVHRHVDEDSFVVLDRPCPSAKWFDSRLSFMCCWTMFRFRFKKTTMYYTLEVYFRSAAKEDGKGVKPASPLSDWHWKTWTRIVSCPGTSWSCIGMTARWILSSLTLPNHNKSSGN